MYVCISEPTVIILPCATLILFHYPDGKCWPCGRNRMFQYLLLPFVVPVSMKDKRLPSCFHRPLCCAPYHQLIPICLMPFSVSSCHVAFGSLMVFKFAWHILSVFLPSPIGCSCPIHLMCWEFERIFQYNSGQIFVKCDVVADCVVLCIVSV